MLEVQMLAGAPAPASSTTYEPKNPNDISDKVIAVKYEVGKDKERYEKQRKERNADPYGHHRKRRFRIILGCSLASFFLCVCICVVSAVVMSSRKEEENPPEDATKPPGEEGNDV